jgi:hypothetical protein
LQLPAEPPANDQKAVQMYRAELKKRNAAIDEVFVSCSCKSILSWYTIADFRFS